MSERIRAFLVYDPTVARWCFWRDLPPEGLRNREGVRVHPFEVEIPDEPVQRAHRSGGKCLHDMAGAGAASLTLADPEWRRKPVTCKECLEDIRKLGLA